MIIPCNSGVWRVGLERRVLVNVYINTCRFINQLFKKKNILLIKAKKCCCIEHCRPGPELTDSMISCQYNLLTETSAFSVELLFLMDWFKVRLASTGGTRSLVMHYQ